MTEITKKERYGGGGILKDEFQNREHNGEKKKEINRIRERNTITTR